MAFISRSVIFLAFLYFLQGLPYGLQSRFLPLYFRSHGMSLADISYFKLLLAPWMMKALWAPFVDQYGTKKQWLSYSMFGLFLTCIFGMFTRPENLLPVAAVLFMYNLLTSTQDIAVDGLAIQMLLTSELAAGNTAQVVGFKLGAVFSGGGITWLSDVLGLDWSAFFVGLGLFYITAYFFILYIVPAVNLSKLDVEVEVNSDYDSQSKTNHEQEDEKSRKNLNVHRQSFAECEDKDDSVGSRGQSEDVSCEESTLKWLVRHFQSILQSKETRWTLFYVLIYKLGEQGALTMLPLYLVDGGVSRASVGFWTMVGQVVSIAGSILGGTLVSTQRYSAYGILYKMSVVRVVILSALVPAIYLTSSTASLPEQPVMYGALIVIKLTLLLGSGVVTTSSFTLMMYCSQRSPSATQASHYTTLATVEVLGKLSFSVLIGHFTDYFGYSLAFILFVFLAVFVLPILWNCPKSLVYMNGENKNAK